MEPQGKMAGQPTGSQKTPKGAEDIQPQEDEGKEREKEECENKLTMEVIPEAGVRFPQMKIRTPRMNMKAMKGLLMTPDLSHVK